MTNQERLEQIQNKMQEVQGTVSQNQEQLQRLQVLFFQLQGAEQILKDMIAEENANQ
jgi:uncharacterized phage infection (PIP) family protein YhgE